MFAHEIVRLLPATDQRTREGGMKAQWRKTLASTNVIESAFSVAMLPAENKRIAAKGFT